MPPVSNLDCRASGRSAVISPRPSSLISAGSSRMWVELYSGFSRGTRYCHIQLILLYSGLRQTLPAWRQHWLVPGVLLVSSFKSTPQNSNGSPLKNSWPWALRVQRGTQAQQSGSLAGCKSLAESKKSIMHSFPFWVLL